MLKNCRVIERKLSPTVTLYCADFRTLISSYASLFTYDTILTDPVWPNCPPGLMPGYENPDGLFAACIGGFLRRETRQLVVCLRSDCDVRMLRHVPKDYPFQQCAWLPYIVPGYTGRILGGNEIAYVFGTPIPSAPGQRVIPAMAPKARPGERPFQRGQKVHPCPRTLIHQQWLVRWFSLPGTTVLDPYMGSGTTGVACVEQGRGYIGIEINRKWFDYACTRIENAIKHPFTPHAALYVEPELSFEPKRKRNDRAKETSGKTKRSRARAGKK